MSAKKVPRGAYTAADLETHRMRMSEVAREIRNLNSDGSGRSAPRNLNWFFPGLREPRCSVSLTRSLTFRKNYPAYSTWDYTNKVWVMHHCPDPKSFIKSDFTDGEMRAIGHGPL